MILVLVLSADPQERLRSKSERHHRVVFDQLGSHYRLFEHTRRGGCVGRAHIHCPGREARSLGQEAVQLKTSPQHQSAAAVVSVVVQQ